MGLLPSGSRADPRLTGYLLAAFAGLVASIFTGRAEVAATAAPFAALAALGLADRRPPAVTGRIVLLHERVLEGDDVHGQVQLDWAGVAELDVLVTPLPGVDLVDPAPALGWALPAQRGPVALGFTVKARAWGRHTLGPVHVRARRRGGLAVWEEVGAEGAPLRVLPGPLRLDRLLRPREPRAVSGAHISRHRGGGTDFADLRPYVAGDRLRDLSWSATARAGEPWVTVHHPERTGTLVLLVDAAVDGSAPSTEALARIARSAWAIAENHLRHQDRVGLLALVGGTIWLDPRGGRRGRWQLLDALLSVGAMAEDRRLRARWRGHAHVPADAYVVAISSLRSTQLMREVRHLRRAGNPTGAVVIDTTDLAPTVTGPVEHAAQRLWRAELEAERQELEAVGVPTALVTAASGVAPAVSLLARVASRQVSGRPR